MGCDLHSQAVMFVAADRGLDLSRVLIGRAVDERDVRFVNLPLAKLLRQSLVYLVRFGDDDQAGCVFVEAVNDADSEFSGLTR